MKKKLLSIVLAGILAILPGCSSTKNLEKFSNTSISIGFNTSITLIGYCSSQTEFDKYFEELSTEFTYYNQLFDRYNDYDGVNNIKTINDNAGISPVKVDQAIIDMLKMAKEYYDLSDGAFDITIGKVLEIWHTYREAGITANSEGDENPAVPTQEELEAARIDNGWDYVVIDEENRTVYLSDPRVSLDVGGIAKGYTSELVALKLIDDGLTQGAINGGGNVRLIGNKPDGSKWSIGVTEPDNTSQNAGTFYADKPYSFVTSGDYQRYYTSGGKVYSHIMDPDTLQPANKYRSVTIVAEYSGIADCLSTALFVMDKAEGQKLIDDYNSSHTDQIGAYWIYDADKKPSDLDVKEVDGYWVYASENIQSMLDIYGATK